MVCERMSKQKEHTGERMREGKSENRSTREGEEREKERG
jgi:hypothetical protein